MYYRISRKPTAWIALLATWMFLFATLQPIPAAFAATYVVNDAGDAGDAKPGDGRCATANNTCTLRAAVEEANEHTGPNTISIPAMTIYLGRELRVEDEVGDDSLHIKGEGENETILDGSGKTRVFFFAPRSGEHSISDLSIQNANNLKGASNDAAEKNGGGVYNEATLTMTNVTVKNSVASAGAGVFNQLAFTGPAGLNVPSLTLKNVKLLNNRSNSTVPGVGGGALVNGATLYGDGVVISGNTAVNQGAGFYNNSFYRATLINFDITNNNSRYGSGVNNDLGEIHLSNGKIAGNVAQTGGAGIYNNDGTMVLTNILISENRVTSSGGYGGGLYNNKIMELNNVSITGNAADYGAGIINGFYPGDGTSNSLRMTNVTISGNLGAKSAALDTEGAGIFNIDNGHIEMVNSTIVNNFAEVGGGITIRPSNTQVSLKNTILFGNDDDWGATDCRGSLISEGHNIIGNPSGSTQYSQFRCSVNLQESDKRGVDPQLGQITGYLAHYPLLPGSPAVEAGTRNECPDSDIRGVPRPQGQTCDIGAYEFELKPVDYTDFLYLPIMSR